MWTLVTRSDYTTNRFCWWSYESYRGYWPQSLHLKRPRDWEISGELPPPVLVLCGHSLSCVALVPIVGAGCMSGSPMGWVELKRRALQPILRWLTPIWLWRYISSIKHCYRIPFPIYSGSVYRRYRPSVLLPRKASNSIRTHVIPHVVTTHLMHYALLHVLLCDIDSVDPTCLSSVCQADIVSIFQPANLMPPLGV